MMGRTDGLVSLCAARVQVLGSALVTGPLAGSARSAPQCWW